MNKKVLLLYTGLELLALLVAYLAEAMGRSELFARYLTINSLFFFVLTILGHRISERGFRKTGKASLGAVLFVFTMKLILGGTLVLIWIQIEALSRLPFFLAFSLAYALFSVPEVIIQVQASEKKKNENGEAVP